MSYKFRLSYIGIILICCLSAFTTVETVHPDVNPTDTVASGGDREKTTAADSTTSGDYYFNLGRSYLDRGDLEKGTELIKKSLEINPSNVLTCDLLTQITDALAAKGQWQKAEDLANFCNDKFELFEYKSWAKYVIAEMSARQQKFDKAIEIANLLLKEPLHERFVAKCYSLLSNIYLERKEFGKSIETGEKALAIAPDDFLALNSVGASWMQKAQYEKSAQSLTKAFLLCPTYEPALYNIGHLENLLKQAKMFNLAKDLLVVVISNSPNAEFKRMSQFELAKIYLQTKEPDKATEELNHLLKDSKDQKETSYIYGLLSTTYGQKKDIIAAEKYAVMAGPIFYFSLHFSSGMVLAILFALSILIVFIAYRGYTFFKKKDCYKEKIYRFRDLSLLYIFPIFIFSLASILLNLVVFRSVAPPLNSNFSLLLLSQGFLIELLWAGVVCYLLFIQYKLHKEDVGLSIPAKPFILRIFIVLACYAIFNQSYEFVITDIFKIQLPTQMIIELLKTIKNLFAIIIIAIIAATLIPLFEEIIFRGFFYPALKRHMGIAGGIITSSFLFAMIHIDIFPYGLIPVMALGAALAYLKEKTNSLVPPIILHGINNLIAFLIFYITMNK